MSRLLCAIAGIVIAIAGIAAAANSDHGDVFPDAVAGLAVGASFLVAGLIAWTRRPANRIGRLMVAAGLAFGLASWQAAPSGWMAVVGAAATMVSFALFVHTVLAFPSGVLETRGARAAAAGAWAITAIVILMLPLAEPQLLDGCEDCPANPIAVTASEGLTEIVLTVANGAVLLGTIAFLVVSIQRWRTATPRLRRVLAPVLMAAALVAVIVFGGAIVSSIWSEADTATTAAFIVAIALVPLAFLAGLLRDRLQRSAAMQELVLDLAAAPDPAALRDVLARALEDPTLAIAFWFEERGIYVDAIGQPIDVPPGRGSTVVEKDGEPIARLVHDPTLDDQELLDAVAAAAAIGLERARLEAALRARLDDLRASRARIVSAGQAARRQIERDLHDGAQQRLVGLAIQVRLLRARLGDEAELVAMTDAIAEELHGALADLRELARGIHPAILSDRGLSMALTTVAERTPVPVEVSVDPDLELDPDREAALYYSASEALTNVVRYAHASHVDVSLVRVPGAVRLEVADDGVGGADPAGGSGLAGLRDRVEAFDGRLEIVSPPGAGTVLRVTLPVPVPDGGDRSLRPSAP